MIRISTKFLNSCYRRVNFCHFYCHDSPAVGNFLLPLLPRVQINHQTDEQEYEDESCPTSNCDVEQKHASFLLVVERSHLHCVVGPHENVDPLCLRLQSGFSNTVGYNTCWNSKKDEPRSLVLQQTYFF